MTVTDIALAAAVALAAPLVFLRGRAAGRRAPGPVFDKFTGQLLTVHRGQVVARHNPGDTNG